MGKKKAAVIVGCAAVVIIGAALMLFNFYGKKSDPKSAVTSAILKTYGEINRSDVNTAALFAEILGGRWRQELTLGVNNIEGDLLALDPMYLSTAQMLTFKSTTRRDTEARKLLSSIGLQFAVTTLAELNLYADPDTMAINMPQAFDYFITINPRRIAQEWDESLLGAYVTRMGDMILEDAFYDYYLLALSAVPGAPAPAPAYAAQIGILADTAEYADEGKVYVGIKNLGVECDAYTLTFTEEAVNAYWREVNPADGFGKLPDDLIGTYLNEQVDVLKSLRFEGGARAWVFVYEGKVASFRVQARAAAAGETWDIDLDAKLTGETASLDNVEYNITLINVNDKTQSFMVRLKTEARVGNPELVLSTAEIDVFEYESANRLGGLSWNLRWDRSVKADENFTFNAALRSPEKTVAELITQGTLTADAAGKHIDANLKTLALMLDVPEGTLDASFNIKYLLRTDEEDLTYNSTGAKPITHVNELDALGMYGKLSADPQLGSIIGEIFDTPALP